MVGYDEAMNALDLERIARQLQRGEVSLEDFLSSLSSRATADVGEAQVDLDRTRRCGYPEVVFGEGKTAESIEKIFRALLAEDVEAFATRIDEQQAAHLGERFPTARYNALGRTIRVSCAAVTDSEQTALSNGCVTIVTAGTSDRPVAEEARETALWMGADVTLLQDIGVAGPHRLLANLDPLRQADAVVVIAGMEGALPSVVGGHVDCPVVAVPTSVGYGASFGGVAALLGMLNSCASNVTVVNIDAGFKGAYVASLIARNTARGRRQREGGSS